MSDPDPFEILSLPAMFINTVNIVPVGSDLIRMTVGEKADDNTVFHGAVLMHREDFVQIFTDILTRLKEREASGGNAQRH